MKEKEMGMYKGDKWVELCKEVGEGWWYWEMYWVTGGREGERKAI